MSIEYQLVEQRTENPCVPGSIPGDTTSESESCRNVTLFFCCEKWSENGWKWGNGVTGETLDKLFE